MNESKYPKSLFILLALNLCLLLTMLLLSMDEIGDGTRFVSGMTGMQSIVMALGLGLIGLPKARGKRLGMLGILGITDPLKPDSAAAVAFCSGMPGVTNR